MFLTHSQMYWAGHLARMEDLRLPQHLFNGELQHSRCLRHKPKKDFKDVVKYNLRELSIDNAAWEQKTINRSTWKKVINKTVKHGESNTEKWTLRKQDLTSISDNLQPERVYNICSRACLAKAGLISHMRSRDSILSKTRFTKDFQQQPSGNSSQFCDKVCRSTTGLRSHMKVLEGNINRKDC